MNTISYEEMLERVEMYNEASDYYKWSLTFDPHSNTEYSIVATAFDSNHGMISVADACKLMVGVSSWYFATFEVNPLNAILMEVPSGLYLAIRCYLL